MNRIKQFTLSNPIYNRLVQWRNLRTPFVHAVVTSNTGRLLIKLEQLMDLVNSTMHRATANTLYVSATTGNTDSCLTGYYG